MGQSGSVFEPKFVACFALTGPATGGAQGTSKRPGGSWAATARSKKKTRKRERKRDVRPIISAWPKFSPPGTRHRRRGIPRKRILSRRAISRAAALEKIFLPSPFFFVWRRRSSRRVSGSGDGSGSDRKRWRTRKRTSDRRRDADGAILNNSAQSRRRANAGNQRQLA